MPDFIYSLEEGIFLVKLARRAIEVFLTEGETIPPPKNTPEKLKENSGVFVTLNTLKHNLRGCIGHPYPNLPLAEATISAAISSAVRDPRFPALSKNELEKVLIEVTCLTPPKKVEVEQPKDYPRHIKVGRDGLIVKRGVFSGLLLPQVPVDWNWNEEQFLSQTCVKAGLPPDSWLLEDTEIFSYQSEIFEETEPKGEIIRRVIS